MSAVLTNAGSTPVAPESYAGKLKPHPTANLDFQPTQHRAHNRCPQEDVHGDKWDVILPPIHTHAENSPSIDGYNPTKQEGR